ncbi:hypothetical protein CERSUDRAFT_42851 [Gelatoporia subvermispora B]|uniref:WD repeat-containing protein 75 second beta-propeller domain-containing protein n=1 Tax=Ceriporiopsis subvermispora (strain B) TaxID=914234 RepID=M2PYG9_CERS8|nr:hypothetical protein CERSUDRAFT_42851 [Gelatoporia subvermispora B]
MTPLKSRLDGQHLQDSPSSGSPKLKRNQARAQKAEESEPSAAASTSRVPESKPWSWRSLTDAAASRAPPFFTKDGRYFFAVVGSSVKIYSVATGQIVSTLDAAPTNSSSSSGRDLSITSAILSPHNPYQIITGSIDGYIRVWDFLEAVLLQTVKVSQPILNLTAHDALKDHVFVAVSRRSKKQTRKDNAMVLRVSLKPTDATAGLPEQISSEISLIGRTRSTTGLALSPSGAWLVATGGHKAYVCSTANVKAGFTKFVSPEHLTCLAFHPTEEYFATGDSKGVVRVWYCLNEAATLNTADVEKTAQTTTLHWHAHAVSSLAFTANGAYLLSGGEEAVMVIWQLHTGKQEFVPRVGSPIAHVAVSNTGTEEEYLLSLADASFVFVRSGTMKISKTIARVKLGESLCLSHDHPTTSTSVPLAVHPPTSTFVLPSSHPSSLQTFSPSSSRLTHELEVSPSNRVSKRDENPLEPSRVESAVMSEDGQWMATIDSRAADDTFRGEVYLKFWSWEAASGMWTLNTRIDRPHGVERVTSLAFAPGSQTKGTLFLVSTGGDGHIKTWRIRSVRTKSGDVDDFWVVRSSYSFRSEIPRHVSWSLDGSVLCISFRSHVALFDPITNSLHQVLTTPQCKDITSAFFIGNSSRYLAVIGTRDVLLWDLVAQTIRWQYRSSTIIERVVPHPREEIFAVFERGVPAGPGKSVTQIVTLNSSSPVPVGTYTLPFHLRNAVSHASLNTLSATTTSFTFVGITTSWKFVVFGDEVRLPDEEGSRANEIIDDVNVRPRTLFQDIFGKSAFANITARTSLSGHGETSQPWRGKEVAEIFDAPAYLMPPLDSVFDALTDGFLSLRPAQDVQDISDDEREHEDVDMELDVDEDHGPVIAGTAIDRVVSNKEMDSFVELFKQYALKGLSLRHSSTRKHAYR